VSSDGPKCANMTEPAPSTARGADSGNGVIAAVDRGGVVDLRGQLGHPAAAGRGADSSAADMQGGGASIPQILMLSHEQSGLSGSPQRAAQATVAEWLQDSAASEGQGGGGGGGSGSTADAVPGAGSARSEVRVVSLLLAPRAGAGEDSRAGGRSTQQLSVIGAPAVRLASAHIPNLLVVLPHGAHGASDPRHAGSEAAGSCQHSRILVGSSHDPSCKFSSMSLAGSNLGPPDHAHDLVLPVAAEAGWVCRGVQQLRAAQGDVPSLLLLITGRRLLDGARRVDKAGVGHGIQDGEHALLESGLGGLPALNFSTK
jgi:hypothetical protein